MRPSVIRNSAPLVFALALLAPTLAAAQAHEGEGATTALGEPYIDRPMVVEPRHFEGVFGFGFGANGEARNSGAGMNADVNVGIVRGLEIGAGMGFRFGQSAVDAGAERYARVNDEWIPIDHVGAGDHLRDRGVQGFPGDRALGEEVVTDPYFRLRYAPLNTGAFMLGIEAFSNAPLFNNSCWSPGVGVPIHVRFARRFRIETGFFHEFLVCPGPGAYTDTWMYIPFRFNIQIVERFWLGVRSGLEVWNYTFESNHYYIPLGFQAGVRLIRQVDLMFDLVFPEWIHANCDNPDCSASHNVFFEVWGFGVSALLRLPD